ncbi:MAG TPA: PEP-utilizing enzyme [Candidatus Acidoferrales bacterium]|nr:PEP-utilizing enzyme [Candidatus Acidoferrales bacterium]
MGKITVANKPSGKLHSFRARPKSAMGGIFPALYAMQFAATAEMKREYGLRAHATVETWVGDDLIAAIDNEEDFKAMGRSLVKRALDDPKWLDSRIEWCEGQKDSLIEALEGKLPREKLQKASNAAIAEAYGVYVDRYATFHLKNMPMWWFGGEELETELAACIEKGTMSKEELAFLLDSAEYVTESADEEMDILAIAALMKKKGGKDKIKKMIKEHTHKYFHIPFGYCNGVVWNEAHFEERARKMASEMKDPAAERAKRTKEFKDKAIKQRALMKKLGLDKRTVGMIEATHKSRYLQDLKKTVQTRGHPYYHVVIGEMAKRLGVDKPLMQLMSEPEIRKSLLDGKIAKPLMSELKMRNGDSVCITQDDGYTWKLGKEAVGYCKDTKLTISEEEVKEITGSPASGGKVRGTVRVCLTSNDIGKIKEGDILVTAMTTPDFVPAMKIVGAIVTDEGGILCHAAIISREMNKPCVIGTKNATKVLKDGMMVEVDADKGKISIL